MHYIMHEIERTMKEHVTVGNYVVSDGEIVAISEEAIDLSNSLVKLSKMLRMSCLGEYPFFCGIPSQLKVRQS